MTGEPTDRPASILLGFRARNSRSFRDGFDLSLLATRLAEPGVPRAVGWNGGGGEVDVLPVAALFGGNASGKTNLLRAMRDLRQLVLRSFKSGDAETPLTAHHPFLLDDASRDAPTSYEIDLVLDGVRHEYGCSFDGSSIIDEWAYRWPKGRRALLFNRTGTDVELGADARSDGRAVQKILRHNALFLSTAAAVDHPTLSPLYAWFSRNLRYAEEETRGVRQLRTVDLLQDPSRREDVLALLRVADLGIENADVQPVELDPEFAERLKRAARILAGQEDEPDAAGFDPTTALQAVRLLHRTPTGPVAFSEADESQGTRVWLGLVGPVLDALVDGAVLLADELDASLHPALVRQLVRLFQRVETNPNRAQLVVNLHDVSLLASDLGGPLLGRDQCWFTEKHDDGSTHLLSLADQSPRKGEAIASRYLTGRYGGVPMLSDAEFDAAIERWLAGAPGR